MTIKRHKVLNVDKIKKALVESPPEVRLLWAIVISGVESNDRDYFKGDTYIEHCRLLGVDPDRTHTWLTKAVEG